MNTFFAQLETRTGMCEPLELAKEMGVKVPQAQQVPSWILGVSDADPLTMAQAYATFAARGLHCDPRPVTQVLDSSGASLKDFASQCEQVMPGATADAVNDILRGVMEGSGFGAPLAIDKPSAGKTGTNNSNMAVWFVGYTPTLATAAMVAGANEFGEWVSLNGQVVGGSYDLRRPSARPSPARSGATRWPRRRPSCPTRTSRRRPATRSPACSARVPDVAGQSVEAATAALQAAGFTVADGGQVNSETGAGLVAYTSPEGGAQLSSGDTVTLYTSTGYVPPPPSAGNSGDGRQRQRQRGRPGSRQRRRPALRRPSRGLSPAACAPRPPRHLRRHDP